QEEAVMLKREMLLGLANAAFTERHELLALCESAHGDGPFLECDWHREVERGGWRGASVTRTVPRTLPWICRRLTHPRRRPSHTMHKVTETHNSPANSTSFGEVRCVTTSHSGVVETLHDGQHGGEVLLAETAARSGGVEL